MPANRPDASQQSTPRRMTGRPRAGFALAGLLALLFPLDGSPARGEQPGTSVAAAAGQCHPATFRVVVDVGHTLDVPGAISSHGVTEYAFNLQLGQETVTALGAAGFAMTTLLVTNVAPWAGLVQRATFANTRHADLFISIHHDSVPDDLLQTWEYEGQQYHFNDNYPGYAIFISNDNADRAGSLTFGRLLGKELQARGLQYTPHYTLPLMGHRRRELIDAKAGVYSYDQLIVLRLTQMPAVLLEAGSIINRQEELQLATPERRATTSAAIVAAVQEFCEARARAATSKTAAPPRSGARSALPPAPGR